MLLLYTSEKSGSVFLRTDQLDGETDWKLRKAVRFTQHLSKPDEILSQNAFVMALPPNEEIYDFKGYL
jgi:phospholipid-translocating ATPase